MKSLGRPLVLTAGLALTLALSPLEGPLATALADEPGDVVVGGQTTDGDEDTDTQAELTELVLGWHLGNWWAWHPIVDIDGNGFCDLCWAPIKGGCQPDAPDVDEPETPDTDEPGGDTENPGGDTENPGGEGDDGDGGTGGDTDEPGDAENPDDTDEPGGDTEDPDDTDEPDGEGDDGTEDPGDGTVDAEEPSDDVTNETVDETAGETVSDATTDDANEELPATGDASIAVSGIAALGASTGALGVLLRRRRS